MTNSLSSQPDLNRIFQQLGDDQRSTSLDLYLTIPEKYHQEPIVSQLSSRYGLNVNILAATLGANGRGSGWFHLVLTGTVQAIKDAVIYLDELNVILNVNTEEVGW